MTPEVPDGWVRVTEGPINAGDQIQEVPGYWRHVDNWTLLRLVLGGQDDASRHIVIRRLSGT